MRIGLLLIFLSATSVFSAIDCGRKVVFSAQLLSRGSHTLALLFPRPDNESSDALQALLESLTHARQFLNVVDGEAFEGHSPLCSFGHCVIQYFPEKGFLTLLLPVMTAGENRTDYAHLETRMNQVAVGFMRAARRNPSDQKILPRVRLTDLSRLSLSHIPANSEGVRLINEILTFQQKDHQRLGNVWSECLASPYDRFSGPMLLERWFVGYFDQSGHAQEHVIPFTTFLNAPARWK